MIEKNSVTKIEHDRSAQSLQSVEPVTPMTLLNNAISQGKDIGELTQLFDLQQRWEAAEAKKAYTAAMAEFKRNPPKILKDQKVSYTKKSGEVVEYDHASLAEVCSAIISGLAAVGISHSWKTKQHENGLIYVKCILTHAAGYSDETSLSAMPDCSGAKNAIQAVGSTVSYLERYTVLAATGLAVHGMDDDGAGAGAGYAAQQPKQAQQTQQQSQGGGFYPQADFDRNFASWSKSINSGSITPEQVIYSLNKKGVNLTENQKSKILGVCANESNENN